MPDPVALATFTAGKGPTLILVHGNSCSSRAFSRQLESSLPERYRLLAIDLPGHGSSPPATDPDAVYSLPGYADAIVRTAEVHDAKHAVFVGWSLGGHVLLEAAPALTQAAGFFIFGTPPVASFGDFAHAAFDNPAIGAAFRADSTDGEVSALVSLFVRAGAEVPPFFAEDFRRTDPRAREALARSLTAGRVRDEVAVVAGLSQPIAIVHGMGERAIRRSAFDSLSMPTLWRGRVQEVTDAGHAPQWESPQVFNRLLDEFAEECFAHD